MRSEIVGNLTSRVKDSRAHLNEADFPPEPFVANGVGADPKQSGDLAFVQKVVCAHVGSFCIGDGFVTGLILFGFMVFCTHGFSLDCEKTTWSWDPIGSRRLYTLCCASQVFVLRCGWRNEFASVCTSLSSIPSAIAARPQK